MKVVLPGVRGPSANGGTDRNARPIEVLPSATARRSIGRIGRESPRRTRDLEPRLRGAAVDGVRAVITELPRDRKCGTGRFGAVRIASRAARRERAKEHILWRNDGEGLADRTVVELVFLGDLPQVVCIRQQAVQSRRRFNRDRDTG